MTDLTMQATLCSEWPLWLHDAVEEAMDLSDTKDWSSEQVVGYAILKASASARENFLTMQGAAADLLEKLQHTQQLLKESEERNSRSYK